MGKQTTEAAWVGQPARVAQTRRNAGLVGGAFVLTLGLVGVGAAGMWGAVEYGLVETPRTQACQEATERSDELNAMSEEYSELVGRAIEAAFSFDEEQVAAVEAEGEAFAQRYQDTLAAYETARDDCRAAGGDI